MVFNEEAWGATYTYDPEKIEAIIRSFNLQGRKISDIKAIGMDYMHREEEVSEFIDYETAEDDYKMGRYMEIDQPLLIKFDNGETFEIETSWSPLYGMKMNSLPWDIEPSINYQNVDASIVFSNCIGETIENVEFATERSGYEDEHSTIIFLEKDTEYISGVILWLSNGVGIKISPYYDFTHVDCIDRDGEIVEIRFGELKKALDFMNETA